MSDAKIGFGYLCMSVRMELSVRFLSSSEAGLRNALRDSLSQALSPENSYCGAVL